MTLDPPAEAGQTIGVSYRHGNATAASKVQDLAGNIAGGFLATDPPVPVQNVTPGVETVAFAGTAGALGIGGKVAVDVTFTEAVRVTGAPTLDLKIGGATRPAVWKAGQAASAVQRFEYTVVEGDEDNDGIEIEAGEIALPNKVANFTTGSGGVPEVDNRTPSVRTVAFAGTAQALAIDGKVAVDVTFTEAVRVTGRPTLAVRFSGNTPDTRQARYVSGTGTDRLRFEYTVVEGDEDTDGIEIEAGEIALPSGSSIVTATGRRTVQRGYDAVAADPARIVDGIRPTADTAAAEGLTVTVTWSEAIDPASARNGAGGFVLRYGGRVRPAVTAVAVDGTDGTKVRLTVDAQIPDGTAGVTLAWSPPGSGAKVRDLAGNEPEAFTASGDRIDVSVTPDTTAPQVASARVDGAVMTLTFDEPLAEGSVPAAPGGFTVTVTRGGNTVSGHTVSGVGVSGAVVTLALARGVLPGDAVTLAYVKPSTPLRDRASMPNEVASFHDRSRDAPGAGGRERHGRADGGAVEDRRHRGRRPEGDADRGAARRDHGGCGARDRGRGLGHADGGGDRGLDPGDRQQDPGERQDQRRLRHRAGRRRPAGGGGERDLRGDRRRRGPRQRGADNRGRRPGGAQGRRADGAGRRGG